MATRKGFVGRKITWGDKISEALKGRKLSQEQKDNISKGVKKHRKENPEIIEQIRKSNTGKKRSREFCKSVSDRQRGKDNPNWKGKKKFCPDCNKQLKDLRANHCRSCFQKGERSHNWKGGKSLPHSFERVLRNHPKYKAWRKEVLKRDNKTCILCKSKKKIQVDHIIPYSYILNQIESNHGELNLKLAKENKLLWDISNGRSLCKECHINTDTYAAGASNFKMEESI